MHHSSSPFCLSLPTLPNCQASWGERLLEKYTIASLTKMWTDGNTSMFPCLEVQINLWLWKTQRRAAGSPVVLVIWYHQRYAERQELCSSVPCRNRWAEGLYKNSRQNSHVLFVFIYKFNKRKSLVRYGSIAYWAFIPLHPENTFFSCKSKKYVFFPKYIFLRQAEITVQKRNKPSFLNCRCDAWLKWAPLKEWGDKKTIWCEWTHRLSSSPQSQADLSFSRYLIYLFIYFCHETCI